MSDKAKIIPHVDLLTFKAELHEGRSKEAGEDIIHFEVIDSATEIFYHFMLNKGQLERVSNVIKCSLGVMNKKKTVKNKGKKK